MRFQSGTRDVSAPLAAPQNGTGTPDGKQEMGIPDVRDYCDDIISAPRPQARLDGDARTLRRRRLAVIVLNAATVTGFMVAMVTLFDADGFSSLELLMLAFYAVTLPWLSIGFWNGLIGFAILHRAKDPAAYVNPHLRGVDEAAPVTTRTAIVMAIRNEDPAEALGRLEAMHADIARTAFADRFDVHVLSDTDNPAIARREEALFAAWQDRAPHGPGLSYRRRTTNEGFKAGNIGEFVTRRHGDYDFFLPLDADSTMSAAAILRLVRIMQASPAIGILQGLVVGAPSRTFFTRAFQFGMRHGMRSFTLGSAWWQGDCGPFWGHNALVRMCAFHDHCKLPVLSGRGPLSGDILSHDQVEAALMRRAGYEVRVYAREDESHEQNPPSLPDFIKREIRWCQGNMQYLRLLGMSGLPPTTRVQLALAILMYLSAPAWMAFVITGAIIAGTSMSLDMLPVAHGLWLFAAIMTFNLTPKLMGLAQVVADDATARRYGGRARVMLGGLAEIVFSTLVAPCVALALTICILWLMAGRRVQWDAQQRNRDSLAPDEAARALWPQTVLGLALAGWLALTAPWALAFAAPIVVSLALAIPLAVFSTRPGVGSWTRRTGLFDIPEDRRNSHDLPDAPPTRQAA